MAFAAYRVLRDVLAGGDNVFTYPGNQRGGGGGSRRRRRKLTVSEIADILRKVPVEEFVFKEEFRSGECSVTRMKRLMTNCGATEIAASSSKGITLRARVRGYKIIMKIVRFVRKNMLREIFYVSQAVNTSSIYAARPSFPLCKANID
jgi:hypothetical protein